MLKDRKSSTPRSWRSQADAVRSRQEIGPLVRFALDGKIWRVLPFQRQAIRSVAKTQQADRPGPRQPFQKASGAQNQPGAAVGDLRTIRDLEGRSKTRVGF